MGTTQVNARVQKHRDALRAAGLRPIQIWVPDTRRADFADECRRQCLVVRNDPQEAEVMAWLDAVADTKDWE